MKAIIGHQIKEIPLNDINIEGGIRKETGQEDIVGLAGSIKKCGLLQAVGVVEGKDGKFDIVFGSRRVRAAIYLGMDKIPARIINGRSPILTVLENIQRVDLNVPEQACAIKALVDEGGFTRQEVGEMLGKSESWISRVYKLATIIKESDASVSYTKLAFSTYLELVDTPELISMAEKDPHLWDQKKAREKVKRYKKGLESRVETGGKGKSRNTGTLRPVHYDQSQLSEYEPVSFSERGFVINSFTFNATKDFDCKAVIEKMSGLIPEINSLIKSIKEYDGSLRRIADSGIVAEKVAKSFGGKYQPNYRPRFIKYDPGTNEENE